MNGFKFTMQGSDPEAEEYNRFIFPDIEFLANSYIVIAINSYPPIDNQNVNPKPGKSSFPAGSEVQPGDF